MGTRYLVDTNGIIHAATKGKLNNETTRHLAAIFDLSFNISVISKIELLSKDDSLKPLIDTANIYPISEQVIAETIKLRRKYKIKLTDAIIAGTAIAHKFDLITSNARDFINFKGLTVFDPLKYK